MKWLTVLLMLCVFELGAAVILTVKDFSLDKPSKPIESRFVDKDGEFRVVCLGDSVTWGWDNKDDETYPHLLDKLLPGHTVYNAGKPGARVSDLFKIYGEKVLPLNPDFVVLQVGWNHIAYEYLEQPKKVKWGAEDNLSFIRLGKLGFRYSKKLLTEGFTKDQRNKTMIKRAKTAGGDTNSDALHNYGIQLYTLISLMEIHGAEVILVTLPNHLHDDSQASRELMLPQLWAWPDNSYDSWSLGVSLTMSAIRITSDLMDLGLAAPNVRTEHFTDMLHLTKEGNLLLAMEVKKQIDLVTYTHPSTPG